MKSTKPQQAATTTQRQATYRNRQRAAGSRRLDVRLSKQTRAQFDALTFRYKATNADTLTRIIEAATKSLSDNKQAIDFAREKSHNITIKSL